MNKASFDVYVKEVNERRVKILGDRGEEYDKPEIDTLTCFKKTAAIANALEVAGCKTFKGSDIASILVIVKQVRDANLKQNGKVVYDPVRLDTVLDWHNYVDLKTANEADEELQ